MVRHGTSMVPPMPVVSALKAPRALEFGGDGYLIYAIDASLEGPDIQEILIVLLQILRERQLYAKLSKREFWIDRAIFLGHLTRKDVPFVWTAECEESFYELRRRITTAPVLALPSGSGGFVVHTDASLQGASNPVEDALSRKVYVSSLHTSSIARVVEECCSLCFTFQHKKEQQRVRVSSVLAKPALYTRIRELQVVDLKTQKLARLAQYGNTSGFHLQNDGLLCLSGRVVVPDDSMLREEILSQAHRS
ncbi:uncharacterized protein [Henckelia pumila]|uniref:uncharacterized protein n=1 Tax=Henckelia pumila TaxID=405737 RepID=UPI003C6DE156